MAKPSAELRAGYEWHIGNIQRLDDHALYFAIGRVTKRTLELWLDEAKSFAEVEFEGAPYTHGIVDINLELIALARKTALAPTTTGIANKLARLLNSTHEDVLRGARIDIAPIHDPTDFIESLRDAYAIRRFSATFRLPNPWDVDKHFQKPVEEFTKTVRGEKTKTTVSGKSLHSETLEEVTRSAAATGSDVEAWVQPAANRRPVKKRLRGDLITYEAESVDTAAEKRKALRLARDYYEYVRERANKQ